ncbi:RNA methyltransferase [Candidatus Parabeggiatoa sp. HSG14]|uniref:RNA methyltransferase n=1 Tax=Candidatus Parabeggiatoa sp. HSG14 TaxID=3055593 RepID=UPI0025A77E5A|nr:RNA methyltransferase [Thiotrichales bacterium HSG14]
MLDKIQIVLVGVSHPGNIGAAARAMKTMGLSHLRLVQPKSFPCVEATARASGADDLLVNAQVFDTFEESVQDCHLIIGTSARQRMIAWPVLTPKACAEKARTSQGKVAYVFGREQSGLTNKELDICHFVVQIPTNPTFTSLNVAAAVQILAYELRCAFDKPLNSFELSSPLDEDEIDGNFVRDPPASNEAMARFYQHLEQTLIDIDFLDPQKPKLLMRRLHRLFNRMQLLNSEVQILRGILTAASRKKN